MADISTVQSLNELSREIRFGAVLYGGVSLAVYENGVTQELYRATKGANVYTVIKQLTGCDIVLDIISGTSAGGINGILIAYALANDFDPARCADLWREDGDILKLLHEPTDPAPNSILKSREFYQPRLQQAFESLKDKYEPQAGDLVSPVPNLDLFITGTDAYGNVYTEYDNFGHAIDIKNHRALFHLRYREGSIQNDFDNISSVFAKLSRITSCFPVAFEPVQVNGIEATKADDDLLRRWGHLAAKPIFFMDGGILNNKPFSSTLEAIFHHSQTRAVDRFLVYVEPDPEQFNANVVHQAPDVLRAAGDGLSRIPGYQSIASDLGEITAHNNRVQRDQWIENTLRKVSELLIKDYTFSAPATFSEMEQAPPQQTVIYLRSRLTQVRERVTEGVLKERGQPILLPEHDPRRTTAALLVRSFEAWQDPEGIGVLHEFDIYYRIRRIFYATNWIDDLLNKGTAGQSAGAERGLYRDLWRRLNHRATLLDIVLSKMEDLIDLADFKWENAASAADANSIWQKVQGALRSLLDPNGLPRCDAAIRDWDEAEADERSKHEKEERRGLYEALQKRIEALQTAVLAPNDSGREVDEKSSLLLALDQEEWRIFKDHAPRGEKDTASQQYCRFIFVDLYLFPMRYMSNMPSTDIIRTVRISPLDAKLGFSGSPKKVLCGNELAHFGGFLKSAWRANDLMWGRLDGACQIIQCIVTPERLRKLDPQSVDQIITSLKERCGNSDLDDLNNFGQMLRSFAAAPKGSDEAEASQVLKALVTLAQAEILQEEVPKVVEASISQQAVWNHYDLPDEITRSRAITKWQVGSAVSRWRAGRRQADLMTTAYAASRFTDEAGATPATQPGRWVKYFENEYDLRGQTWQSGVPKPVLMEIFTTAILVLRKCFLTLAQEQGYTVGKSMTFRLMSWPLWIGYALTRLQRLAPEYLWNCIMAVMVFCVTVLGMDLYIKWKFSEHLPLMLWAAPGTALMATCLVLRLMYRRYRPSASTSGKVATLPTIGSAP